MDDVDCERGLLEIDACLSQVAAASDVLVSNVDGVYSSSISNGVNLEGLARGRAGAVVEGRAGFAKDVVGDSDVWR